MRPPIPDPFEIEIPRKKLDPQPVRWNTQEKCFFVVYECSIKGRLRFLPKHFVAVPTQIPLLFALSPVAFGVLLLFNLGLPWPLLCLLAAFIGVSVMLLIVVSTFILSKWTRPAIVKITGQGIVDEMPSKTIQLEWNEIAIIRNLNGDLLFRAPPKEGCIFYRENFSSRAEADKFFEIAHRLWESQGAVWDEVVRQSVTSNW